MGLQGGGPWWKGTLQPHHRRPTMDPWKPPRLTRGKPQGPAQTFSAGGLQGLGKRSLPHHRHGPRVWGEKAHLPQPFLETAWSPVQPSGALAFKSLLLVPQPPPPISHQPALPLLHQTVLPALLAPGPTSSPSWCPCEVVRCLGIEGAPFTQKVHKSTHTLLSN